MARHCRAQVYRDVARSFREEAAKAKCPGVRIQMFYTARGYDQMAESIERSARKIRAAIPKVASYPAPAVESEAVAAG
jgi:hypothetical protein